MFTRYNYPELAFSMDGYRFIPQNIVFEQFQRVIPRHEHSKGCYEIHFIPYGCGTVILNEKTYDLDADSLYVTGPHIFHEQFPAEDNPMAEYCLFFQTQRETCKTAQTPSIVSTFLSTPLWIGHDTQDLHSLMQKLFQELAQKKPGYRSVSCSLLQQIIVNTVRNYHAEISSGIISAIPEEQQSLILDESFLYDYSTLTLNGLSRRLSLSPRQTERLVIQKYNQTFQEKKTAARMSAAVILLQSVNLTIADIAEQLGFSTAEHFTYAFRRYTGMSPRQYRKKLKS
ncbi:MAG: AraC family transcriptional regulator [Lachnospiraceae bacterium]|jgi:AraC-like DNA-binding protein